jgi:mono/diheme cytochrome c family protein
VRKRLADSTVEALIVLSVLTVAFAGAIAGITIWLVNYDSGTAAAATQPATTEAATTAAGTTEAATTVEATTTEATTAEATTAAATTAETGSGGGDATAGKQVFASAGCASCHTLADAGATGTVGPNLDDVKPDEATVVQFVTNGSPPMPAFGKDGILTPQQIQDVAAYVSQVAGG